MQDRVIQFEVWNECNNGCKFCSNKFVYDISDEEKIRNLDICIEKIKDPTTYKDNQRIGFIGGEFFQGQLRNPVVKEKFFEMVKLVNNLSNDGYFNQIWFTATLTIGDHEDLWKTIELIDRKEKIWICTSYDTIGRFHTEKMLKDWDFNMKEIKRRYPEVMINVTSILTDDLVKKYLSGEFNFGKLRDEYNCTWYFKPPMIPSECRMSKKEFDEKVLTGFFPRRDTFLKFLVKYKNEETSFDYDRLFDTHFRADKLIKTNYNDKSERMVITRDKETNEEITEGITNDNYLHNVSHAESTSNDTNKVSRCQHNSAYSPYIDSDRCFYCDKEMIGSM